MTSDQELELSKKRQNLDEKTYLKQRDDEIVDALRAKFGRANQLFVKPKTA